MTMELFINLATRGGILLSVRVDCTYQRLYLLLVVLYM